MTLRLNGATSGYTEIDAPAVAGSNTLVLPGGNGSADQALVTNGSGTLSFADRGRMVLETAKAYNWNGLTTNTSLDFTSIPSWVKRITVIMNGVSTNGASILLVQLGDSGGVETTGYLASVGIAVSGSAGANTSTAGFLLLHSSDAAAVVAGALTVLNVSGNSWVSSWAGTRTDVGSGLAGGGTKTLSATLDRLRITTVNGSDTFDAGTINLLLEG